MMTAEKVSAHEAQQMGMIYKVFANEDFELSSKSLDRLGHLLGLLIGVVTRLAPSGARASRWHDRLSINWFPASPRSSSSRGRVVDRVTRVEHRSSRGRRPSGERRMRVAVVQFGPHLRQSRSQSRSDACGILAADADLVVFPECALRGYSYEVARRGRADRRDRSRSGDERARGGVPSSAMHRHLRTARAGRRSAVQCRGGGRCPSGLIGRYRKMHLPFLGVDRFADPGDLGFPVFETPLARVSVLICFDWSFPGPRVA